MTWVPTGAAATIAMIGHPVAQTVLPARLNALFAAAGIDAAVVPFDLAPDALDAFLQVVRGWGNCRGVVVTAPHKQAVRDRLDTVDEAAAASGAVNLVRRHPDGRLTGDNIDGIGFVAALARNGFAPAGARILMFGCGGAGAAIAGQLVRGGARALVLCDPDAARARTLAARLGAVAEARDAPRSVEGFDLVVNATAIGLHGEGAVHSLAGLAPGATVADVVTKPPMTPFLTAALAKGARVQTGAEMAEGQVALALERFGFELPR